MSPAPHLSDFRSLDVHLWIDGSALRYNGPEEVLTDEVLAALKSNKRRLVAQLRMEAASAQAAPVAERAAPVEVEAKPQVHAAPSTWDGSEVLRPDLRWPLGLEALDADPPEAPPMRRAWASPAVWVRDLGVWQHWGACVPTPATRANWERYRDAKRAKRELHTGAAFALESERLPHPDAPEALPEAIVWARRLLGADADADAGEVERLAAITLDARRAWLSSRAGCTPLGATPRNTTNDTQGFDTGEL